MLAGEGGHIRPWGRLLNSHDLDYRIYCILLGIFCRMFVRIETVGSCCSLITDLFYERHGTVYSQILGHLLRGQ